MAKIDKKYHELLQYILDNGRLQDDPNRKEQGIKRLNIPRYNFEYDLKDGFPAITTKELYWKGIVGELLWFLKGDTHIKYLLDNGINIWNKDCYNWFLKHFKNTPAEVDFETFIEDVKSNFTGGGNCGRIYGAQWRKWIGIDNIDYPNSTIWIDQISDLIKNLKEKPLSSSHIVTAWNPAELDQMALPPCHKGFQLMVYELTLDERTDLKVLPREFSLQPSHEELDEFNIPKYGFDLVWEQRSVDTFLGLPFNIASYALLAHIIGKIVNMVPNKIYGDLRNVHIYSNHLDAVKEQLTRDVNKYDKCELSMHIDTQVKIFNNENNIDKLVNSFSINNFKLKNYNSYPNIKAEMLSRDV